jgi:hypothetical protein
MGQRKLFMTFLRAEMEDSVDGLTHLSERLRERFEKGEITNYVFSENSALLSREISAIRSLIPVLDTIAGADYPDVHALARNVEETLHRKAEELEDPEAVSRIITRKIQKILMYILEWPE